jgi:hypothetical protein
LKRKSSGLIKRLVGLYQLLVEAEEAAKVLRARLVQQVRKVKQVLTVRKVHRVNPVLTELMALKEFRV